MAEAMDVTVILKDSQKQPDNRWLYTYNGQPTYSNTKSVTVRLLTWDQTTVANIISSLVITQVENINIVKSTIEDQSAYYLPSMVELRVGYEFERYDPNTEQKWVLTTFDVNDMDNILNLVEEAEQGKIRVPYLIRAHIEAAGWIYSSTTSGVLKFTRSSWSGDPSSYYGATILSMQLQFKPATQEVRIHYGIAPGQPEAFQMFFGQCKSYNELITVMYLTKAI